MAFLHQQIETILILLAINRDMFGLVKFIFILLVQTLESLVTSKILIRNLRRLLVLIINPDMDLGPLICICICAGWLCLFNVRIKSFLASHLFNHCF